MLTERTSRELNRLKGYRPSKFCTIPDCKSKPAAGFALCRDHHEIKRRRGSATARPLSFNARRVYIRACRAYLTEQLRRGDITVLSTVRHLAGYIERACLTGTFAPSDLGRRGIKAETKVRSILHATYKRFGNNSDITALAVLSVAMGVTLACRVEPEISRDPAFSRAAVCVSLWTLVRLPPITNSVCTYKPHRPALIGRHLHNAFDKAITQPFVRWVLTEEATRLILPKILVHGYARLKWGDWQKWTQYSLTRGLLRPDHLIKPKRHRKEPRS